MKRDGAIGQAEPAFEAVIFDCDGVLVDSEVLVQEIELAALAELGLHYDAETFARLYMGLPDPAFFAALDVDFRRRSGRPLPETFARLHHERVEVALRDRLTAVEGADLALSRTGRKTAVASSSGRARLEMKLRKVGLWDLVAPHVYSAEAVKRGKPAPDLFLHAAEALAVAPSLCLVVEDSVNGVRAGRAAGMTVWGFTGGGHCSARSGPELIAAGASRLVPNWAAFTPALASA